MAAWLGSYGPAPFGGGDLPRAGAVIMQYTGHGDYTENDPPTFACVGERDGIANWRTMERRLQALSALGIPTEFHHYPGLSHGSGQDQPDKMAKAGLHGEKSPFVDAPLLKEFPVALECKLVKITEEGNIIGQIVNVSADEAVLGADGKIDFAKFRPIAYEPVHNGYHVLGERVGNAFQDGAQLK